jgi:hypothetical protein
MDKPTFVIDGIAHIEGLEQLTLKRESPGSVTYSVSGTPEFMKAVKPQLLNGVTAATLNGRCVHLLGSFLSMHDLYPNTIEVSCLYKA